MKPALSPLNTTKVSTAASLLQSPSNQRDSVKALVSSFSASESLNASLTQVGAIAWTHSASGGKFRAALSRKGRVPIAEQSGHWSPFLGYVGPTSTRSGYLLSDVKLSRLENFGKPEAQKGQCFRLDRSSQLEGEDSTQRALLYIKLREDGCSKAQSIVYTRRRKCMYDSTIHRDGPSCHRTVELGDNRAMGPNWNGWQLHSPRLMVPRKYMHTSLSQDHREYEVLAREFERLSDRKQRQAEGMDFEQADKDRIRFFAALQKEWEKRQGSRKLHSDFAIPEEPTPAPEPEVTKHAKSESMALPDVSTPTLQTETVPRSRTPKRRQTIRMPSKPIATLVEPSWTSKFGKGLLVMRSLLPTNSRYSKRHDRKRKVTNSRTQINM